MTVYKDMSNNLTSQEKILPFASSIVNDMQQHLITLQIDLTDNCVCKCKGCSHWQWDDKKSLDYDILKKNVLDNLGAFRDLQSIVLSGGEPLMYRHIEEICKQINVKIDIITSGLGRRNDVKIGIITSGLGRRNVDWKVLSENCEWIRFSVDGFTRERFHETRGVDLFDKWVENLDTLLELNKNTDCKTRLNYTIHEYNYKHFHKNVLDFVKAHNVGIYFWLSRELISDFRLGKQTEVKDFIVEHMPKDELIDDNNVLKHIEGRNTIEYESCYIPRMFALIASDGLVFPCCYMYEPVFTLDNQERKFALGNINEKPLSAMYSGQKFREIARLFHNCQKSFSQCKYCDRYDYINKYLNDFEKAASTENKSIFL